MAVSTLPSLPITSRNYNWSADVLFYQMVARSEHALDSHQFNSTEQRFAITQAFATAKLVFDRFVDRRVACREAILAFQTRVYSRFWESIFELQMEEMNLRFVGPTQTLTAAIQNAFREGGELRNAPLSDGQCKHGAQLSSTIAEAFRFIVGLKDANRIAVMYDRPAIMSYTASTRAWPL
jgi:hypothetical protein